MLFNSIHDEVCLYQLTSLVMIARFCLLRLITAWWPLRPSDTYLFSYTCSRNISGINIVKRVSLYQIDNHKVYEYHRPCGYDKCCPFYWNCFLSYYYYLIINWNVWVNGLLRFTADCNVDAVYRYFKNFKVFFIILSQSFQCWLNLFSIFFPANV